ncbi:imidazole glycerol phosphate synthase subunit HisH [Virgibacillus siamensis]|uniref:imidazole glycerol phosphate synthase subunit HisH n=1 Tax=Virgibacillus siamensis TaxID=480071 RepID=UPI00098600BB|nr:imidazole glycerol phosphate synthase subunit HisH [Virgibacillus siamensis]
MIAIIDYGAGNIKSLQFACQRIGLGSCLTTDNRTIEEAAGIILPGVGAFKDAMNALDKQRLTGTIQQQAAAGKPLLGICLGMQLFYEQSFENGSWQGLGLLKGNVSRLPDTVKVPHMGWNTLQHHRKSRLLNNVYQNEYVYFVHSYAVTNGNTEDLVSTSEYGGTVPAIVQSDNIIGMQFHPEKSGKTGLQLLKNYGEMVS